jgi:hypothetical protein
MRRALLLAVVLCFAAPQAASAAVVAFWHMNELSGTTMFDSVGGNNGTLRKVQVGQTSFDGSPAYRFIGLGSVATVPSSAILNPGAADYSVSLYFKTSNVTKDDSADVIRKGLSTNSKTFWKMELRPNNGHSSAKLRCYFRGTGTTASIYATPVVTDGNWHSAQCFKTATAVGVVFDGKTRTKAAKVGSISNGASLSIGAKSASDDAYTGLVDEVSISR